MGQHVSLEITSTGGRKVALITIEKLFYRVSEHVRLKGIRPRKGESTLCVSSLSSCAEPPLAYAVEANSAV